MIMMSMMVLMIMMVVLIIMTFMVLQVGSLLGKILGLIRDFTVGLTVARLLKLITTLCSLIIMAVGGSLLALGLWKGHAMLARSLFPSLSAVSTTALPTACVAVGAAALLLGALGLLGVYREGKWLLAVVSGTEERERDCESFK
ncbi:unnamed protein product [Lampetra planeri]